MAWENSNAELTEAADCVMHREKQQNAQGILTSGSLISLCFDDSTRQFSKRRGNSLLDSAHDVPPYRYRPNLAPSTLLFQKHAIKLMEFALFENCLLFAAFPILLLSKHKGLGD